MGYTKQYRKVVKTRYFIIKKLAKVLCILIYIDLILDFFVGVFNLFKKKTQVKNTDKNVRLNFINF